MLQPHEQRVVNEAVDLDEKTLKLRNFLDSDGFQSLDEDDKNLLLGQFGAMCSYLAILSLRINKYDPE